MPYLTAYAALLLWPVVTLILMLAMPAHRAVIWSLVGGFLLLPVTVQFDIKVVPALDKSSIPSIASFLLVLLMGRRGTFRWPRSRAVNLLMLCFVVSPFLTGLTNGDPIIAGTSAIPAMTLYTSASFAAANAISLLPFILGAGMLRDEAGHRDLLMIFAISGLLYTLPVLAEIRLSPFIASRIYHVGSTEYFLQQIRGGGFRSMVFLGHGLLVSTFLGLSLLATAGLWRARRAILGVPAGLCVLYLLAVLVLNKSMGALVLALFFIVLLAAVRPRRFIDVALVVALVVVTYPVLRASHMIPTERILSAVGSISPAREESLGVRFHNEDILLERANDRPLLGWGAYGRNRVYRVTSEGSIEDVSITDGTWIIIMGSYGWIGYLSLFGLLCYPLWHVFKRRHYVTSPITLGLVAMLAMNLLDLVPNSSLRPITWLIAGALSGVIVQQRAAARRNMPLRQPLPQAQQEPAPV